MDRRAPTLLLLVGVLGCGRFGFDATGESDPDVDAAVALPDASAATDAPVAATGCGDITSLLCDGFETDLSDWTLQETGGVFELVAAPVFRGAASLRVSTVTAGAFISAVRAHDVIDGGTLHYRAYYYLPSTLITPGLIDLTTHGEGTGVHTHISLNENSPILLVNEAPTVGADPIQRDRWMCFELAIELDATNGAVELRIDGDIVAIAENRNTVVPGGYDALELIVFYEDMAAGAFEYFVDEVAVSDQRIGCQ